MRTENQNSLFQHFDDKLEIINRITQNLPQKNGNRAIDGCLWLPIFAESNFEVTENLR